MALSRIKNWIAETLTYSDLNAEFNNILQNPGSLICPITFNLTFTDNTYDIGASGATRPRDLFLSRNLVVGGNATLGDASGDSITQNALTTNFVNGWNGQANGSNAIVLSTAGEMTKPLQPAFLATNLIADTDQTGDGTAYTLIADDEQFDQNSDYNNTTGVFTAPVTGRYMLGALVVLAQLGAAHTGCTITVVTSNRSLALFDGNPGAIRNTSDQLFVSGSFMADMDAADTASIVLSVSGSTKTVDIAVSSRFYGALIC